MIKTKVVRLSRAGIPKKILDDNYSYDKKSKIRVTLIDTKDESPGSVLQTVGRLGWVNVRLYDPSDGMGHLSLAAPHFTSEPTALEVLGLDKRPVITSKDLARDSEDNSRGIINFYNLPEFFPECFPEDASNARLTLALFGVTRDNPLALVQMRSNSMFNRVLGECWVQLDFAKNFQESSLRKRPNYHYPHKFDIKKFLDNKINFRDRDSGSTTLLYNQIINEGSESLSPRAVSAAIEFFGTDEFHRYSIRHNVDKSLIPTLCQNCGYHQAIHDYTNGLCGRCLCSDFEQPVSDEEFIGFLETALVACFHSISSTGVYYRGGEFHAVDFRQTKLDLAKLPQITGRSRMGTLKVFNMDLLISDGAAILQWNDGEFIFFAPYEALQQKLF